MIPGHGSLSVWPDVQENLLDLRLKPHVQHSVTMESILQCTTTTSDRACEEQPTEHIHKLPVFSLIAYKAPTHSAFLYSWYRYCQTSKFGGTELLPGYSLRVPRQLGPGRRCRSHSNNVHDMYDKWKNHFYEMKGDVGMSLHEKERNKKMPTPRHKVTHNPIPTSLFCFMLFVCLL